MAIINFGYQMFNDYGDYLGVVLPAIDIDNNLEKIKNTIIPARGTKDKLDELMVVLANMADTGNIYFGKHFTEYTPTKNKGQLNKGKIYLAFRFDFIIETCLSKYLDEVGVNTDLRLTTQAYNNLIDEKLEQNNSYIVAKSVNASYSNDGRRKATIVDYITLRDELGINPSTWLRKDSEDFRDD